MIYFSDDELRCKCGCGEMKFDEDFRGILDSIRADCGFALPVSSGYRCPAHPIEAAKPAAGSHTTGRAVDIAVSRHLAHTLLRVALEHQVPRIGVSQKGDDRFIHLDWDLSRPWPTIWSY